MEYLELNFPYLRCKRCLAEEQIVKIRTRGRGNAFGIYCKECDSLLMWAGEREKVAIKARLAWLKNNKEVST